MSRDSRHINVILDVETDALVRHYARAHNLPVSAVVRDALRMYFRSTQGPSDAGWREGYQAAYRAVQQRVVEAMSEISTYAPTLSDGKSES